MLDFIKVTVNVDDIYFIEIPLQYLSTNGR